jgi:coiled-coil domain-containing protein 55
MKFIIGEAKKAYGLVTKPAATTTTTIAATPAAAVVFAMDDDDNDDTAVGDDDAERRALAAKRRVGTVSTSNRIAEAHTKEALAQDATVFEYDAVFDDMKAQQKQATRAARKDAAREPKYIAQLLAKAEERKRDDELYYEKKLLREQAEEAAEFGDTEKFITSAYRKRMEENRLWREEKERRDAAIEASSIATSGSTALLANILNNRLAGQEDEEDGIDPSTMSVKRVAVNVPEKRAEPVPARVSVPAPEKPVEIATAPVVAAVERRATQGWTADIVPDKPLAERQNEALVTETHHNETTVMSARERYLARKRQREADQP